MRRHCSIRPTVGSMGPRCQMQRFDVISDFAERCEPHSRVIEELVYQFLHGQNARRASRDKRMVAHQLKPNKMGNAPKMMTL
jgi:hypothetical protein